MNQNNIQKCVNQYSKDFGKKTYQLFNEIVSELFNYRKLYRETLLHNAKLNNDISLETRYSILRKTKNLEKKHEKLVLRLRKRLKINSIEKYFKKG